VMRKEIGGRVCGLFDSFYIAGLTDFSNPVVKPKTALPGASPHAVDLGG
jgi:hypothetical protein